MYMGFNKYIAVFSFLLLTIVGSVQAQITSAYRSASNPYYWKNNMPRPNYWQQDVHYEIKANINDSTDIIEGNFYKLTYYNNSPDELNVLYFHLNENAFQPGSYYDNLTRNNHVKPVFGKYEAKGLGTTTDSIKVNGELVKTELDNTILKIFLNAPLKSNASLVVTMTFKTYFDKGSMRRRMKKLDSFGYKQFDGVHWYPSICVYDAKFGWTTDQHLDKEFYSNFGVFDIALTFPNHYVVEATGELVNRQEVLPDSLRAKLDIRNFKDKPFNSAPSVVIPRVSGLTKTWIYHAENVHNFAFTADPLYRIGEVEWKGIKCIALAQEPHAAKWQPTAAFTSKIIQTYSEDFGMYAWPKIIVADAQDGMEYPMLTLDNGVYPGHQRLLAHEVGHMWFYGMVGSNETYRAMMDEGFTQFLEIWSMEKIEGHKRARLSSNRYVQKFIDTLDTRYEGLYFPYLNTVHTGYDQPINTHSSAFEGAIRHGGSYGLVYYKTAVMLYNLRYVLGEELFLNAMKNYFEVWKFKHPYPEDFRQTIIEFTKVDLNWFFDQWMETTKNIDYGIKSWRKTEVADQYEITFTRKGRMQMPIDFQVISENDIAYQFHIPNTWFVKKTSATVLPKWYGWDLLQPEYKALVTIPGRIKNIQIDPEHYMADIDLTDNQLKGGNILKFDSKITNMSKWEKREHFIRPDLWYNAFDGVQIGVHMNGNYMGLTNVYSLNLWYNTRLFQANYFDNQVRKFNNPVACSLTVRQSLKHIWQQLYLNAYAISNVGLNKAGIGLDKVFRKQDNVNPRYTRIVVTHDFMYRANKSDSLYLINNAQWSLQKLNSTLNITVERNYNYQRGVGKINLDMRVPGIKSDFNYSYLQLTSVNNNNLGKFEFKTRLMARVGMGLAPLESQLYIAGASPETMFTNKFTRAAGFVPEQWTGFGNDVNHFHAGGGLNIRGLSGYLVPVLHNGSMVYNYAGNSGASFNMELDFDRFIKIKPYKYTKNFKVDTYIFSDMGVLTYNINNNEQVLGGFKFNAGLGAAVTYKFGPLSVRPLTFRFDMPLFLNATPANSPSYLQSRFVMGINRAF
jgi:aminopeptidase N